MECRNKQQSGNRRTDMVPNGQSESGCPAQRGLNCISFVDPPILFNIHYRSSFQSVKI